MRAGTWAQKQGDSELADRADDTPGGKYPVGTINYDLLMKAAHLLNPGPFMLYVALLVRCAGKTECWPAMDDLATSLHTQIGAIKLWRKALIKANLLDLRIGSDGLEHYIVKLPGEELRREKRSQERERTQKISEQRAAKRDKDLRSRIDERKDESTKNVSEGLRTQRRHDK